MFVMAISCQLSLIHAQNTETSSAMDNPFPKFNLGISTGINNFNGLLGFNAEYNLIDKVSFMGGAGIGSWGTKLSGGARFYKHYPKGFIYTVSFSSCSGIDNVPIELETSSGNTEEVEIKMNRANTLNFTIGGIWTVGKGTTRFHFEGGYGLPLEAQPWEIITTGIQLSETGEAVMNMMSPGGLIITLGITFGI